MQLKKIKRAEKKGTESVMDEKFALLFQSKFQTGDMHLNVIFNFQLFLNELLINDVTVDSGVGDVVARCCDCAWQPRATIVGYNYMGQWFLGSESNSIFGCRSSAVVENGIRAKHEIYFTNGSQLDQ